MVKMFWYSNGEMGDMEAIEKAYAYDYDAMAADYRNGVIKEVTREQTKEVYRDIKGILYNGDTNHADSGVFGIGYIADRMNLTVQRTAEWLTAMVYYRLTERQNGMWVF